jgi:hypothetical protein
LHARAGKSDDLLRARPQVVIDQETSSEKFQEAAVSYNELEYDEQLVVTYLNAFFTIAVCGERAGLQQFVDLRTRVVSKNNRSFSKIAGQGLVLCIERMTSKILDSSKDVGQL